MKSTPKVHPFLTPAGQAKSVRAGLIGIARINGIDAKLLDLMERTGMPTGRQQLAAGLRWLAKHPRIASDPEAVRLAHTYAAEIEAAIVADLATVGGVKQLRARRAAAQGGKAHKKATEKAKAQKLWNDWQRAIHRYSGIEDFYRHLAAQKLASSRPTAEKWAVEFASVKCTKRWQKAHGVRLSGKAWRSQKAGWIAT